MNYYEHVIDGSTCLVVLSFQMPPCSPWPCKSLLLFAPIQSDIHQFPSKPHPTFHTESPCIVNDNCLPPSLYAAVWCVVSLQGQTESLASPAITMAWTDIKMVHGFIWPGLIRSIWIAQLVGHLSCVYHWISSQWGECDILSHLWVCVLGKIKNAKEKEKDTLGVMVKNCAQPSLVSDAIKHKKLAGRGTRLLYCRQGDLAVDKSIYSGLLLGFSV